MTAPGTWLCPCCTGGPNGGKPKTSYPTEDDATGAMRSLRKRTGSTRLNVYPCPKGHGWHVGHRKGTLSKDLERLRRQSAAVRRAGRSTSNRRRR